MPELPEVEFLTSVVHRNAIYNDIVRIDVLRSNGRYLDVKRGEQAETHCRLNVLDVFRVGKHIVIEFNHEDRPQYLITHNAMSGYFDWEHEPETFDYVEGNRQPTASDVRVRLVFQTGEVLRFHDARLFGSMHFADFLPECGPELLHTKFGSRERSRERPIITLREFAAGLQASHLPVKHLLMDQSFLAGIGNIYASEACHAAGVDPLWPACSVPAPHVPLLLEALRWAVSHSIPKVEYSWLNVYRKRLCGSCERPVIREQVKGRSTFMCPQCQLEPEGLPR